MRNNEDRIGVNALRQDVTPPQQLIQAEAGNSAAINFIIPTEFVALPSKGKFYPANHPLHNQETIEIKQMTAKEEDILTSKNLLKKGVALDKLIQSLVVNKAINTDSILIEDRNAILVAARISAYGQDYETIVTCPSCTSKSKHNFDLLEKLETLENNSLEFSTDENGLFIIELPKSQWKVKCRALNGYDEKAFIRLGEAKKNVNDPDSLLSEQLKMMIVTINDVEDKAVLLNAINCMPAKDSKHLRNVYSQIVKGIDMKHSYICSSCDYSAAIEVPLTTDFFWFK
jgi:transposase-like protein